jgi:Family of unknown function (DUF5336)
MTYPYGGSNQYPTQSSAAYGAYWPPATDAADDRKAPGSQLIWVVLLLGLATYLVSYALVPGPGGLGWGVRFSTLAAIAAGLGLLPRQSAHTKLIAALAIMGFLEALSLSIAASDDQNPGWPTIVIVAVNALQALTAIAALLAQLSVRGAVERGPAHYDAYAYYAQPAQQYYAANTEPLQHPIQGQATAQAEAAAPAQAQAPAQAEQSAAERDALYAEYLNTQYAYPNPPASSPGGLTETAQPASGTGLPSTGPTESIRPRNDPPAGSATQSSPS